MANASMYVFARNLRYLMRVNNLTPSDLAARLGVQESRLSNWLAANCYPKQEVLIRLCDTLDYRDIYKLVTQPIKIDGAHE